MFLFILLAGVLSTSCAPSFFWQPAPAPSDHILQFQQAPKAHLTYVAIGASDTYGIGAADPDEQNWPVDLSRMLGRDVRLVNLGIPGVDVHDALSSELPVSLDAHPDLLTVWLAVNDLLDNVPVDHYQQDMNTLLTRVQTALPHAVIAVANVPDLTLLPAEGDSNRQKLQAQISDYNTAIASVVQRHHVLLINLYQEYQTLVQHPEYISKDGFHPDAAGYEQIAIVFNQKLIHYDSIFQHPN